MIFLLFSAWVILAFSACGSGEEGDGDATEPTSQVRQYYEIDPNPPIPAETDKDTGEGGVYTLRVLVSEGEAAGDELAEQILSGLNLRIAPLPYPEDYAAYLDTLFASGDAPDICLVPLEPSRLQKWIQSGAVGDIPESATEASPTVAALLESDGMSKAYKNLYGGLTWYIPRFIDREPAYSAGGPRIFYRKDWFDRLGLPVPETTDDLRNALRRGAVAATDSSACFAYLFGIDPDDWLLEDGRYIPAYYSDSMLAPLEYARRLWEEGLLLYTDDGNSGVSGITLTKAAVLMTGAANGGAQAFEGVLAPLSEALGVPAREVYGNYAGVMYPPNAPGEEAAWGRVPPTEGWVFSSRLRDDKIEKIVSLFEFTLTDQARAYARYGVEGATYTESESGIFFHTDPEAFAPYDLTAKYPAAQFLLGMVTRDVSRETDANIPSVTDPSLRLAFAESAAKYFDIGDDDISTALCKAVPAPERDALAVDYEMFFYHIITGGEPVRDLFERFKERCRESGVEEAIAAVTSALKE
jgi:ABC-type glycerol-3-phosphate transport system substrate-binding protein